MIFKNFLMSLDVDQIKYREIEVASFTTEQLNHGYEIMIQKRIQHIVKGTLLLLKDLLEPKIAKIYKYITSVSKKGAY